ncbi:RNA polymerase sigma factor [Alistipes sp.]|uniref:RNA polymerase sigma factor n=1 Tax=Alistipes sp. TaxID=1872444 RepID=UPI003AF74488
MPTAKDMTAQRARQYEFEVFVREHRRIIGKVCYFYAGDSDDFDDLYQEVLINLWRGFDGFEGRAKASSWVYRVGLNTCISFYRRNRRRAGSVPLADCAATEGDDPERDERLRELYALINRLDTLEKAVVMLWLDEVPYDEIAEITGLTRNNVASKLHRIKLKLREQATH